MCPNMEKNSKLLVGMTWVVDVTIKDFLKSVKELIICPGTGDIELVIWEIRVYDLFKISTDFQINTNMTWFI